MGYSPWGRKESDTTERLHFQGLQVDRETCEEKGRGAGTSPEARVHPPHPPPILQERMGVGICLATPSKPRPRWAPGPGWEEHTGFQDQSRHRELPSQ